MSALTKFFGAATLAFGTAISSAALAQGDSEHACSNITTTNDVTACFEAAISLDNLIKYVETLKTIPEAQAIYNEIDASNENCQYLSKNSDPMRRAYEVSFYNPNRELDEVEAVRSMIKSYFENAAICYSDSLELYNAAGLADQLPTLSIVRDAAQSAANAITLEQ